MFGSSSSEPLLVEVIAYAPTAFYQCRNCELAWGAMGAMKDVHREQIDASLPGDLARDYQAVSDWVRELFRLHCDRVVVKVVDAASLEGFVKTLRYGAGRLPAVIVAGQTRFSGPTSEVLAAACQEIDRRLGAFERVPEV